MKHIVGVDKSGTEVYAFLTGSLVGKRVSRQPQLLALVKEMLATIKLRGNKVCLEYDMHRQVGYDFVIPTTNADTIFYARLVKDDVYTRFVKAGEPNPTTIISVVLEQDVDKQYELTDVWIGQLIPPRPGSADETEESKTYWSEHAYIKSDQPIQSQSFTQTCPY